jgi:Tfp pilus assembly protein PilX
MQHRIWTTHNHRGSVLVTSILTLVLLSLIGIATTTTSRTEVQISGNDKVAKEAFYAAEFGLTTGETVLQDLATRAGLNEGSTRGHYGEGVQKEWYDINWNNGDSVEVSASDMPDGFEGLHVRPRYTLAQRNFKPDTLTIGIGVSGGTHIFNVTAQGTGGSATSKVILRSVYGKRYE